MALQNVVITDGTTSLTFEPFTGQVGQTDPAVWLEKSYGSFKGYKKLSLLTTRSRGAKGAMNSSLKLEMPKAVLVDGVDQVVHTALATVKVVVPDTMTLSERTAFATYVAKAVAASIVTDAVISQRIAN